MYTQEHGFYVAHGPKGPISICGKMANRHGLIAGATGTGKTVSLQVLAESFSQAEAAAKQEKEAAKHSQAGHFYGRKVSDTRNPGQSAEIERGRYM